MKYTLESIGLRVIIDTDPRRDFTRVAANPIAPSNGLGVTSTNVLATAQKGKVADPVLPLEAPDLPFDVAPKFSAAQREQAIEQVQEELAHADLLDAGGKVSDEARKRFSFEKESALPTPGILVKGCLDDCSVCEPALSKEIELELEHKRLQNELLAKQIEFLDKSQEYRCCPKGETASETDQ